MRITCSLVVTLVTFFPAAAIAASDREQEARELIDNYISFRNGTIRFKEDDDDSSRIYDSETIRSRLTEIGVESRVILPDLMDFLRNNPDEWHDWFDYFKEMQGEVVPFLAKELSNDDRKVRSSSLWALEWIGRESEPAIPAFFQMIDDQGSDDAIVDSLLTIGAPKDVVDKALIHSVQEFPEGSFIFQTLFELRSRGAAAIPAVVDATRHHSPGVREQALRALAVIDDTQQVSLPVLTAALTDTAQGEGMFYMPPCLFAANALAAMKERAAPAIPGIIDVMKEGLVNDTTILHLMETLANNPIEAQAAIPLLENEFELAPLKTTQDLSNRIYVAGALMQLDPDNRAAYQFILNVVRGGYDPQHGDRVQALRALLRLGRRDPDAVRILKKIVADGQAGVFEGQFVNKGQFSDFSVFRIPIYADAVLARIDPTDDFTSARIENHIGILMAELDVETLIEMMQPDATYYRKRLAASPFPQSWSESAWTPAPKYVELVVAIDCFDEIAAQIERDMLDLESAYKQSTEEIVLPLKPFHARLTPLILELLEHEDRHVRRRAAGVLGIIGEDNPDAVAGLLRALRDSYPTVRSRAADALGDVAPADDEIRRALQAALDDDYICVRAAAERTIRRLNHR